VTKYGTTCDPFRNTASLHVVRDVDVALRVEHRMLDEPVNPEKSARPVIFIYPLTFRTFF
jgi:hypothetical protein